MKKLSITAIIEKSTDGWYIGQIEEYPEVLSQGKTIDELKDNLVSALSEAMQIRRKTLDFRLKGTVHTALSLKSIVYSLNPYLQLRNKPLSFPFKEFFHQHSAFILKHSARDLCFRM